MQRRRQKEHARAAPIVLGVVDYASFDLVDVVEHATTANKSALLVADRCLGNLKKQDVDGKGGDLGEHVHEEDGASGASQLHE